MWSWSLRGWRCEWMGLTDIDKSSSDEGAITPYLKLCVLLFFN